VKTTTREVAEYMGLEIGNVVSFGGWDWTLKQAPYDPQEVFWTKGWGVDTIARSFEGILGKEYTLESKEAKE